MKTIPASDRTIIRELTKQIAELAALPVMDETKTLWRKLNAKKPERPMVIADQICWNEMNVNDELTLLCGHPDCRMYEEWFRSTIYRWKHMQDDTVVEPVIYVPKAITGISLGIEVRAETLSTDRKNSVKSYHYENQITCMEDIEKIKIPVVGHDTDETARRLAVAHDLFDGIIDVCESGYSPYISIWDLIATWMGVENALLAIIDEPDLIRALVDRMVAAYMSLLDQLEEQGLLCGPQSTIHCTGAWTDELPGPAYDPEKPRAKDIWSFGLAQMLGTCSPAMYDEFEIEPCLPLFERFGLMYYGCCDSLDGKIPVVSKIKNLRKISISPWATEERLAEEIGSDWVFSRKPNPSLFAFENFDENMISSDLSRTKSICDRYGCPLEFILKDLSTVRYQPQRLWSWVKLAKEVACS